jgi:hypothetical protein
VTEIGDICPRCGNDITGFPALSRWDNQSNLCGDCGTQEAMLQFFALQEGKDVKEAIHPRTWVKPPPWMV